MTFQASVITCTASCVFSFKENLARDSQMYYNGRNYMEIQIGFMILGLVKKEKKKPKNKKLPHINNVPGTESYSQRYSTAD